MSENFPATDGSRRDQLPRDERREAADDELALRIARALRSREAAQPDAADVVARIEARLAQMPVRANAPGRAQAEQVSSLADLTRRGGKIVAAGVVITAIATVGAGAAAAANPYSEVARTVENVARTVGIEWSAMPAGYTREQYEAFWGAGYTGEDVQALGELWSSEPTQTKARAGQMILDGAQVPIAPSEVGGDVPEAGAGESSTSVEYTQARAEAFWGAGYTDEDVQALGELWNSEPSETKARAGQMILDGSPLPLTPGEAATSAG